MDVTASRERDSFEQAALTALAGFLADRADPEALLERVSGLLAEQVRALAVSISCSAPEASLTVFGAHPAQVVWLAREQFAQREGPCFDSARTGRTVIERDLVGRGVARWPTWAPQAIALGGRGIRSEPVEVGRQVIGSIGILSGIDEVDDSLSAWRLAQVAAAHAITLTSRVEAESLASQLEQALHSRVRIEQAKGALAAHLGISVSEAFERLRGLARSRNRRLHEVAAEAVEALSGGGPELMDGLKRDSTPRAAPPRFAIQRVPGGLRLVGAADASVASKLAASLSTGERGSSVLVDLRRLEFLDLRCARAIVEAAERLTGPGKLVLMGARPGVSRVLELLDLHRHPRLQLTKDT